MEEYDKKTVGYVYIMTNPCFQENCIKIGESENAEERKNELSSPSGVPLPFELFAYVRSTQYKVIESALHQILTDAGFRINPKREFYRILPQEALKYLKKVALIDPNVNPDEDIVAPDEDNRDENTKRRILKYHVKTNEEFMFKYTRDDIISARLRVDGSDFIVLQGSKIDPNVATATTEGYVRALREANKQYIQDNIIIDDIRFDSPSAAGQFVSGGSSNGKTDWITVSERKPLNDFIIPD